MSPQRHSCSHGAEIQSADSSVVGLKAIKNDSDHTAADSALLSSAGSGADRGETHSLSFSGKEGET